MRRAGGMDGRAILAALSLALAAATAPAAPQRFPQPDFNTGYQVPTYQPPAGRAAWREWTDVGVLAAALSLASWLAVKRRSRRGLFLLAVASLAYFGFIRKGCLCAVGSLQNVALGLADSGYAIPLATAAIFLLPLIFALFFGRAFCASVCPLGAAQEMTIVRPLRLPLWLREILGLLPHVYLALAVALAATGAGFWICRYDPFVGLFRLDGPAPMIVTGLLLLALGTVVARPYCRFLCPYGVPLGWFSRLSRRHLTITPDDCIQCRLCEKECPFDAIRGPEPAPGDRAAARRAFAVSLALIPVFALTGLGLGRLGGGPLSRVHPDVALARAVRAEVAADTRDTTWETRAFWATGAAPESLRAAETAATRRVTNAAGLGGVFLGLMAALRLVALSRRSDRTDFVPDRGDCLSCGRCFSSCPREYVRLRRLDGPMMNP